MNEHRKQVPLVDGMTWLFLVLAVVSGGALWLLRGAAPLFEAAGEALLLLIAVIPIILMAVLLGAYVQKLIPASLARRWVGSDSGLRGLALATVAGALTPGGPFAAFPLVVGLYHAGASLAVCVTYLTAWGVLGVQRVLVWEIAFFGIEFVALRMLVSLPLPFVAGMITALFFRSREDR